jgi:hypothetical protein
MIMYEISVFYVYLFFYIFKYNNRSSLGDAIVLLLTEGKRENLQGIEEVFGEILDESDNDTKFKLFKKIKDFGHL